MTPSAVVVWFRRDLRLADHPALQAAADEARTLGRSLLGLFVVEEGLLATGGPNRRAYLARTLAALDGALDGRLVLRRGRPEAVVPQVAAEVSASTVHATGDCAPYGRRRDARVAEALAGDDRRLVRTGSPYAVSPGRVLTGDGGPYRVFTPFRRAWAAHGWPAPTDAPAGVRWAQAGRELAPADLEPDAGDITATLPTAGEAAATDLSGAFLGGPFATYDEDRDRPDLAGTSRLSPHLRFGAIHPRQILDRVPAGTSGDVFRSELAWREFYADVLWHRPDSAWAPLSPVGAHLRTDTGPEADARFAAWVAGRTGYPLVDAGMRQLSAEGWMHNRLRMLTASFLVKDLHLPWQRGAAHFLDLLVDGDLASNNHGWQWVAGTGTDAAPFYRVFSPDRQAERLDPAGAYVARYVPEHGTPDYPAPIVDHAVERAEALDRWQEAKETAARAGSA
jgi:deoxyribodipyrimidine photo-lyase